MNKLYDNGTCLDFYEGKIVLVHRGECRFDRKALIAQQAGARLVIVIEVNDDPLQRLGNLRLYLLVLFEILILMHY